MADERDQTYPLGDADDAEIRRSLTAELFGPLGASLPAYAAAISVAIIGVTFEGRVRDIVCLVALVAMTAVRICLLYLYRRRPDLCDVAVWETAYGLLAGIWGLILGINCAFLTMSDSIVLQLFGTTMAFGMTGGTAARHGPHPWIAASQMIAILVPYTAAVVLHLGTDAAGLVLMTMFMFVGVWSATRKINSILTSAMRNSIANRTIKDRFDFALNNMSHGLVMLDSELRLEVANKRYAAMFDVDFAKLRRGLPFGDLIDISFAKEVEAPQSREAFLETFDGALRAHERALKTLHRADGSIIECRFEPVEKGGTVLVMEDVTEKHEAAAKIARLAHFDSLTGLPNRSSFGALLPKAIDDAKAGGPAFSLLYLDLDGFKEVNDTLGHPIGDKLLVEVAGRLVKGMRQVDACFRVGGDEFVLLQYAREGADEVLASRLIDKVSQPFVIEGDEISIGLSVGIARFGEDGGNSDELLKNADIALYKAKLAGKQTYRRFRPEMAAEVIDRRILEADLRHAVEDSAIDVHFQPIVDVATGRVVSCEALLRWFHPSRGLMSTEDTVKLAESTGLIVDLGAIIMRKACIEAVKWPSEITVAVNLSAVQFRHGIVVEQITRALASTNLPAQRLEVEITESLAFGNLASVRATIDEVRALGVKVSLDDFGTGYTSLSYLNQIPFDKVKIDRSFVTRLSSDAMAASLIQLMAALLRSLDKAMVVEGVETTAQVGVLRAKGCDLMQGYLFGKPQPADEILKTLSRDPGPQLRVVA